MDFVELEFTAELDGEGQALPPFLGPTLRGAFGQLLKRTVCQVSHGQCDRCLLKNVWPYTVIFEGIPPAERAVMRGVSRVPQPFVLGTPWSNGEPHAKRLPVEVGQLPDRCTLRWRFNSPVQIVREGKAAGTRLDGFDLMLAGRRRWAVMNAFDGLRPNLEASPNKFERSDFTTQSSRLRHWQISRFSGRQQRRVELHGVVGELVVEGPWGLVGDWLHGISKLHLGKSVTFGLGNVEWELLPSNAERSAVESSALQSELSIV